jgi:hypothetical protein
VLRLRVRGRADLHALQAIEHDGAESTVHVEEGGLRQAGSCTNADCASRQVVESLLCHLRVDAADLRSRNNIRTRVR